MATRAVASLSSRIALLALCGALFLALVPASAAAAAASGAGGSAYNELVGGGAQEQTPTTPAKTSTTPTSATTTSGSNSKTAIFLAFGAAAVLLVGIGFVVMRDARKVAPVGDGPVSSGRPGRDPAARLRKRRAQAKAARTQRKRNR
jgi:hypothetical protein